ncbi:MAG TPA: hypothetical protein VFF68_14765 [Anaerolineaceae bacterium]|nr:hypothetical protein [Anaerolineaceae bacterium]
MRRLLTFFLVILLAGVLLGQSARWFAPVSAQDDHPPIEPEQRQVTLTIDYTAYDWWLLRWSDSAILCYFYVDHEGLPTADDITSYCGTTLGNQWKATQACQLEAGQTPESCRGLYLHAIGSHPARRDMTVELSLPAVWLTLEGCTLGTPHNTCATLPVLKFTGEEPLPNETIINIQGVINGESFYCPAESCTLPLQATGEQGVSMEFWAESSFGDASPHFTAQVRVLPWGSFMDPDARTNEERVWYTDVLSSQWRGGEIGSCTATWQVFPEIGGPPPWLRTPEQPADLFSELHLFYLAGALIANGQVDASRCPNDGLAEPLVASQCGVEAAYEEVVTWQNRFDEEIFQVAQDTGVPAQLIKNIFSRESQFWPGVYLTYKEAGLGQLTEPGTDPMLLWNPSFFDQFCPLVLHQSTCDLNYGNLDPDSQAMLRGALVRKVNAACPDCPEGIDLTQATFSVRVFAEGLLANCEQVGRILTGVTGTSPGQLASFEDLWRITLVNYNAGSGCVASAMQSLWNRRVPLTWESFAGELEPACRGAIGYVEDISIAQSGIVPTPTSWVYPGQPLPTQPPRTLPTFTPTPLPGVPTATPRPGQPTATPGGYPGLGTPLPTTAGYPGQPTAGPSPTAGGYP